MVAADGKVFLTALDGTTFVLNASAEFEVLTTNKLGEDVAASFAAAGGSFFVRGQTHLWKLGK